MKKVLDRFWGDLGPGKVRKMRDGVIRKVFWEVKTQKLRKKV